MLGAAGLFVYLDPCHSQVLERSCLKLGGFIFKFFGNLVSVVSDCQTLADKKMKGRWSFRFQPKKMSKYILFATMGFKILYFKWKTFGFSLHYIYAKIRWAESICIRGRQLFSAHHPPFSSVPLLRVANAPLSLLQSSMSPFAFIAMILCLDGEVLLLFKVMNLIAEYDQQILDI